MNNEIYAEDFGSLGTELLKIDYLRFNLKSHLYDGEINNLTVYFRRLEFSFYIKERDDNKKRTSIFDDKYFEVTFVLCTLYSKEAHLEFAPESTNRLYFSIKNNKFNWNQLEQYGTFLGRIDTCYDRIQKSTDKISNDKFIDVTVIQFKKILLKNNIEFRKNRGSQLTSVGHRTSDKYYRVYLKSDCLRFEFEYKHRETLNFYYNLLKIKKFKQLENRISYEFFKQTYQLFRYSQEPEKVEWIAQRLRPFQIRNSVYDLDAIINIHYIV